MAQTNAQIKGLLLDIQSVVESKLKQFTADTAVDQSKVTTIQDKVNEEIAAFRNPELWLHTVTMDRSKVFASMLAINRVNVPDLDKLSSEINSLSTILDTVRTNAMGTAATAAAVNNAATGAPNRNQEALSALTTVRNKISGRKLFFLGQGTNLATNPDFQPLEARQQPLWANYVSKLRSEDVMANEVDVLLLNSFAESISLSTTLPVFFQHYGELSDFIEERAPLTA